MTVTEDFKGLLRDALGNDPEPLPIDQIEARATSVQLTAAAPGRGRAGLGVAVASLACVIAAGAVVLVRSVDEPDGRAAPPASLAPAPSVAGIPPVSGSRVGSYWYPSGLPEGWVLLGVAESASTKPPTRPSALYANEGADTSVLVSIGSEGDRWSSSPNTVELTAGTAVWSSVNFSRDASDALDTQQTSFQITGSWGIVNGSARGIADAELAALFETVSVDASGIPVVEAPSFTLVASSSGGQKAEAELVAHFGPPGTYMGMDGLEVRVTRYDRPIDPNLNGDVWDVVTREGRTIYTGVAGDQYAFWSPLPETLVSVSTYGYHAPDSRDLLARLQPVSDAELDERIAEIAASAASVPVAEQVTFPNGATVELLGDTHQATGICVTIEAERTCDLAIMSRGTFTEADWQIATYTDVLRNGRWYTVGYQLKTAPTSPEMATVTTGDRTWYLIAHPDDALTSTAGTGSESRPAR
jgi:hypothetical protein